MDLSLMLAPEVLMVWVLSGVIAGPVAHKIFFPKRSGAGASLGKLINVCLIGVVGSALGVAGGLAVGLPGAGVRIPVTIGLAVAGSLLVLLLVSRFNR